MTISRLRATAILVLLCGCQSARAAAPEPAQTQPFYCERSHTNHAWSYQHRGIYVVPDGGVFLYEHTRGDQRLLQVPEDSLTEAALLAKYAPGRRQYATLSAAEMARRYAQALEARPGARTERRRRGADMGATVRRCWLSDVAGVYREVFLRQTGDWEQENRSPAASELSAWLDSLSIHAR